MEINALLPSEKTDEELFSAFQPKDDKHALRLLIERHEERLRSFLRRRMSDQSAADDLCQDVFTLVMTKRPEVTSFRQAMALRHGG